MFNVKNGVRQGGILSPILFIFYLEDLSKLLKNAGVGCELLDIVVNHLFYADDSMLLAPTARGLQKLLDICSKYAKENELIFQGKNKIMIFRKQTTPNCEKPVLYIDGQAIDIVDDKKYLGVILSSNLQDDTDIRRIVSAIYCKGNTLIRKFSHCSKDVKAKLFDTYCSSFYCLQLWCSYTQENLRKVQTAYNAIFRRFFNYEYDDSMSARFIECNLDCFKVKRRRLVFSFRRRVLESENVLITNFVNSSLFYRSKTYQRWNDILYINK